MPHSEPMMEAPFSSFSRKLIRVAASATHLLVLVMARPMETLEKPPLLSPNLISSPTVKPSLLASSRAEEYLEAAESHSKMPAILPVIHSLDWWVAVSEFAE